MPSKVVPFTATHIRLSALLGRVVMLHAFQMLSPGCVSHGLPQASRVREMFKSVSTGPAWVQLNHFGRIEDLELGALLGQLRAESSMGDVATEVADAAGPEPAGHGRCLPFAPA